MMQPILLTTAADPRPVALQLFRDPVFDVALLVIALMAAALLLFWLLDVFRTLLWRLRQRAAGSGPAAPGQGSTDGVHIEEPDTDLRRRFFRRVRLLPRALSEGRMNDPQQRQ